MSTALVRPGEITDAADATDLLDQLRAANTLRVDDELDARKRAELRKAREAEIITEYRAKASSYYDGIWNKCGNSTVGHNFITLDVGESTIYVCDTCSFAKGAKNKRNYSAREEFSNGEAKEYMQDLSHGLAKQLMELDEQAGILEWPKDDDFIGLERKHGKKERWWS